MAQSSGDGTAFGRRCRCSPLRRNAQYTGYDPNQVRRSWSLPLCAKPNVTGWGDNDAWVGALLSVDFHFALFCDSITRYHAENHAQSLRHRVTFGGRQA